MLRRQAQHYSWLWCLRGLLLHTGRRTLFSVPTLRGLLDVSLLRDILVVHRALLRNLQARFQAAVGRSPVSLLFHALFKVLGPSAVDPSGFRGHYSPAKLCTYVSRFRSTGNLRTRAQLCTAARGLGRSLQVGKKTPRPVGSGAYREFQKFAVRVRRLCVYAPVLALPIGMYVVVYSLRPAIRVWGSALPCGPGC
ncbi:hypothetical protein C8Q79DRAFT_510653 [Trametes meyenii]|nr:hypothetical protein C8Q79DRAFT_510653 [Trametes meyenii]